MASRNISCSHCKAKMGYIEGNGIFQTMCFQCRSMNVFKEDSCYVGNILNEDSDYTIPVECKECGHRVGRHQNKFAYQIKCGYCKAKFRGGLFGDTLRETQQYPEQRSRVKLVPTEVKLNRAYNQ